MLLVWQLSWVYDSMDMVVAVKQQNVTPSKIFLTDNIFLLKIGWIVNRWSDLLGTIILFCLQSCNESWRFVKFVSLKSGSSLSDFMEFG